MKTALVYILGFTFSFTAISGGMYFLSRNYPWMFNAAHTDNNGGKLTPTVTIPGFGPGEAVADTTRGHNETISTLKEMLAEKNDSLADKDDSISVLDSTISQLQQNNSDDDSMVKQLQAQVNAWNSKQKKNMASAYEDMDPAVAAKIMANLDNRDVIFILSSVRKKQAAKIMGALDPVRAAKLISDLSHTK